MRGRRIRCQIQVNKSVHIKSRSNSLVAGDMASGISKNRFTLALVQLAVTNNPAANAASARTLVLTAARQGAKIVVLPGTV